MGSLFRGFVSRNLHVFRQAYVTYFRALLEYASNVWSPHLLMYINWYIERIERHFTKRTTELSDFSYLERLSILNLVTLENRRLSCDQTLYYKILNNSWSLSEILMLVYHRIVYIPFIMTLIFESQCVELIHLKTISLINVSLPVIVYRVLLSNQNRLV